LESDAIHFCRRLGAPSPTQASVASLPFPNETFDLVASMDVLPHFAPGEEATPFAEMRSEEHTSELQSLTNLVCRLLLEKKHAEEVPHPMEALAIESEPAELRVQRIPRVLKRHEHDRIAETIAAERRPRCSQAKKARLES